jgi:hypothetical protein
MLERLDLRDGLRVRLDLGDVVQRQLTGRRAVRDGRPGRRRPGRPLRERRHRRRAVARQLVELRVVELPGEPLRELRLRRAAHVVADEDLALLRPANAVRQRVDRDGRLPELELLLVAFDSGGVTGLPGTRESEHHVDTDRVAGLLLEVVTPDDRGARTFGTLEHVPEREVLGLGVEVGRPDVRDLGTDVGCGGLRHVLLGSWLEGDAVDGFASLDLLPRIRVLLLEAQHLVHRPVAHRLGIENGAGCASGSVTCVLDSLVTLELLLDRVLLGFHPLELLGRLAQSLR